MRRLRFPIPLSIVLFLLLTAAGAYYVRAWIFENAMLAAMKARDLDTMKSLAQSWPAPVDVVMEEEMVFPDQKPSGEPGRTVPIHVAAEGADAELVEMLLAKGAKRDAVSADGDLPIHLSAGAGGVEATRLLLRKGASVKARSKSGWTPLHLVTLPWNRPPLSPRGDAVPLKPPPPIRGAEWKCVGTAEVLLGAGAEVDARNSVRRSETPLHIAAGAGDIGVVKLLLSHGANPSALDINRQTPLAYALSMAPDDNAAIALIRAGADFRVKDTDNETAVGMAADSEKIDVLRVMVECGLDPNTTVLEERIPLLNYMLNSFDRNFGRPAPGEPEMEFIRLLIEKGADVNARTGNIVTPLESLDFGIERADNPDVASFLRRVREVLVKAGAKK